MTTTYLPLSELAASIAALMGRDDRLAAEFVRDLAQTALSPAGLVFTIPRTLDAVMIDLSVSGSLLTPLPARPAWLAALIDDEVALVGAARKLDALHGGRALLELRPEQTTSGLGLGVCWAPIVARDAIDLLGDPWGPRTRFIERLTPFEGHTTMSVFEKGARRATRLERVISLNGDEIGRLMQVLPACVRDVIPPTSSTRAASDEHAAFLENHLFRFLPEGVRQQLTVTLSWKDGMPPDSVTLTFGRLPLPFVVSLLEYLDLPIASTDRLGALLGLCEAEVDEDGVTWFHGVQVSFGSSTEPDIGFVVAPDATRWFSS